MTLSLAMTVRLLGLVAVALTLSPTHLLAHSQTCSETVVSTQVDCSNFANHRGRLTLVNGIQLVDQFGETVQLRGISSHGLQYFPNCVTKDSIEYLVTTWGINVFRAVVYVDAVDNGYEVNADFFDNFIINIVQWCKELGIYVIIDWHVLLSGDPNAHLDSRGADTGLAVDFWTKYATLYKDETHVLYEIANEPNNIDWPTVLDYHNSIIGVIRAIDSEAIIIAGTTKWCQEINLAYENPVDEPYNVMYAFHFYASEHSNLLPLFEQYMHLMPLFVSEWRISDSTGSGTYSPDVAEQFLDKFAGLDDSVPPRRVVSWVQWSIADKADTASLLQPGACE
jgi:endoglucanase